MLNDNNWSKNATFLFHGLKERDSFNNGFIFHTQCKLLFAKPFSFSLSMFFICIDVKHTVNIHTSWLYCYVSAIMNLVKTYLRRNAFVLNIRKQDTMFKREYWTYIGILVSASVSNVTGYIWIPYTMIVFCQMRELRLLKADTHYYSCNTCNLVLLMYDFKLHTMNVSL